MLLSALREWDGRLGVLCGGVDFADGDYIEIRNYSLGWVGFSGFMKSVPRDLSSTVGLRIVDEKSDSFVLERTDGWGRLYCAKHATGNYAVVEKSLRRDGGSYEVVGSSSIKKIDDLRQILVWVIPPARIIYDKNKNVTQVTHIDQEHEAKILLLYEFSFNTFR